MPYVKKVDLEATEVLLTVMAANESKARKSALRWRVASIILTTLLLYSLF
tara:strand:- start:162 stop:311 length:150 start_codon:yes stop_codon:yes gene_type:complete